MIKNQTLSPIYNPLIYNNSLLNRSSYQFGKCDVVGSFLFEDSSVEEVVDDFRKTGLYSEAFLKDLEEGLRETSFVDL